MKARVHACLEGPGLSARTRLQHLIHKLEREHSTYATSPASRPFGLPLLDEALGGGLPLAALHEVVARSETEVAAATGFVLAVAAHCALQRAVLWIAEDMTLLESGMPYGPGLDEIGLSPEQVTIVTAAKLRDVLWVMEEALRSGALGAVIGEIRSQSALGATASRRLSLAASKQAGVALLLRGKPHPSPVTATTRWVVAAAPSAKRRDGTGPPTLAVELVRNRHGRLGSWVLEWNRVEHRFQFGSADPQHMAAMDADRPRRAATGA